MRKTVTIDRWVFIYMMFALALNAVITGHRLLFPPTPAPVSYTLDCPDGIAVAAEINGVTVHCGETVVVDR